MSKGVANPIGRNNKFYSDEDFQYELSLIEEYLEEDLNQVVVVYEVDRMKTNVNSVYKETKGTVRFKPPKEIPCMYEIKDSQIKSFDNNTNTGVYSITGSLIIQVPDFILKKYGCNIRRGDYIGVPIDTNRMYYFSVSDDGRVNASNKNYIGSYKPVWLTIECAPVSESEFNGK